MKNKLFTAALLFSTTAFSQTNYPIVDTDVSNYFDNSSIISAPTIGQAFYGQDAHYNGNQPSYTDNNDGTITDNVTGLIWEKDMGSKINPTDAITKADTLTKGGFTDWRVPTLKELYSLILFTGESEGESAKYLYIDTNYFNQPIGNVSIGEREIDAQTCTLIRIESESTAITNLEVYPNPSRDVFNVSFVSEEIQSLEIRVVNLLGEVTFTESKQEFIGEYSKQFDLATFPKGIYMLEIETNNGVVNKKLILQ